MTNRTLRLLVENIPGVLARVGGVFSRHNLNIEYLAVGRTDNPAVATMAIVVAAGEQPFARVTNQLDRLVNVIEVEESVCAQPTHRRHDDLAGSCPGVRGYACIGSCIAQR